MSANMEPSRSGNDVDTLKGPDVPDLKPSLLPTRPLKGFRDMYPEDKAVYDYSMGTIARVAERFGYQRYDGPMLESWDMYVKKSGEELGGKQLYHFTDKGGREVAIRPEMTPTLARMVAAKGSQLSMPLRWYSTPNLLRYEAPQRGRTREHSQMNVDIIGSDSPYADAEIIEVGMEFMKSFGADTSMYVVRINDRRLMNSFFEHLNLSGDQTSNLFALIDRKEKISPATFTEGLQELQLRPEQVEEVQTFLSSSLPELQEKYNESLDGISQLSSLFQILEIKNLGDSYTFDPTIVRGIGYYTGTVFEMHDKHPKNNRALFGGGRYDDLLGMFQESQVTGVGFGFGDVTLRNFLESHNLLPDLKLQPDVKIVFPDDSVEVAGFGFQVAQVLREADLNIETSFPGHTKMKNEFKSANNRSIPLMIVIGGNEVKASTVQVKDMRSGEQAQIRFDDNFVSKVKNIL